MIAEIPACFSCRNRSIPSSSLPKCAKRSTTCRRSPRQARRTDCKHTRLAFRGRRLQVDLVVRRFFVIDVKTLPLFRARYIEKRVITFKDIEAARDRIAGAVYYSPCRPSIPLSETTGMEIFCKLDNLQRTGSFKERGARN